MTQGLRRSLVGGLLGVILGSLLTVNVEAQGPYAAQIQRALAAFVGAAHTWTGTQTFTNITVNGVCTGCGVSSPLTVAVVQGGSGTTSTLTLQPTSGVGTTGADIIFKDGSNGATEVGRFAHGGLFTTNAAAALSADAFVAANPDTTRTTFAFQRSSADTGDAVFQLRKSRGTAVTPADAVNGDTVDWSGGFYSGGTWFNVGQISAVISGTFTSGQRPPGDLVFATSPANTSLTERWRINAAGHLIAGADNSYDVGASGATRPRTVYAGTSAVTPLLQSTTAKVLVQGTGTGATQLAATQTTAPTCTTNCGTSPSVAGTDTFMTVTMGASGVPASGWVVTFNGTWAAAPACHVQMGLAGMVVGKMPLTVATTTTTITVVTNGTAPSTSDKYHIECGGLQ